MYKRPTFKEYSIRIAQLVASRSTCIRRQVGCVLTNQYNHIIGTGYNGAGRNQPHCLDVGCLRMESKSGESLDNCRATHAEQNALLQCTDVNQIKAAYVTAAPCMTCTKLLLNTSCETIYFLDSYGNGEAIKLWKECGRNIARISFTGNSGEEVMECEYL